MFLICDGKYVDQQLNLVDTEQDVWHTHRIVGTNEENIGPIEYYFIYTIVNDRWKTISNVFRQSFETPLYKSQTHFMFDYWDIHFQQRSLLLYPSIFTVDNGKLTLYDGQWRDSIVYPSIPIFDNDSDGLPNYGITQHSTLYIVDKQSYLCKPHIKSE